MKVHVHTNNPGQAIEKALELGSLDRIKIENMKVQHTQKIISTPKAAEPVKVWRRRRSRLRKSPTALSRSRRVMGCTRFSAIWAWMSSWTAARP